MSQPLRVVFALFPRLTHLDFTGPHQVLSMLPGAEIVTASLEGGELTSDNGLVFAGLARLEDIDRCDVICVPGGIGTSAAMEDLDFLAEVERLASGARYVTSVCTGSLVLGAAGLLKGKRAACHWGWREHLADFGAIPDEGRVVRDGNVLTGGGVTAGIDFALTLVAEIAGDDHARLVQLMIEYAPNPPFDVGRPELAHPDTVTACRAMGEQAGVARKAAIGRAAARLAALA